MKERHFTSTAYIIDQDRVLLLFHQKFKKWMAPGGHLELNETPVETTIREVKEETGLEIEIYRDERFWIETWNGKSFERPHMCILFNIPEQNGKPPHQHMDFVYLAKPIGGELSTDEGHPIRWFTLDEILALAPDQEIFEETQQVIKSIFHQFAVS